MSEPQWGLVCPFLNETPDYAHGVEFGMLYNRMCHETEICDWFTTANQEQITLLCNRTGWKVDKMEQDEESGWTRFVLTKVEEDV